MSKTGLIIFGIFAAISVLLIPFLALNSEGAGSAAPVSLTSEEEEPYELFVTNCGACHTLKAAGTDGVVGPDLDGLFGNRGDIDSNESVILSAIQDGRNGRMPAGILGGQQAKQVAAFVADRIQYTVEASRGQ